MNVHTSTVGYYGIHYKTDRSIKVNENDLTPCAYTKKIQKAPGFDPMLLSEKIVREHALPSAVVWRAH